MIISKKKYCQDIADVAERYEERLIEMEDKQCAIQNTFKERDEEYERMLKKYDEIHGVSYKGQYINEDGQMNMKTYFRRKKDIYDQGIADGESPFLS